LTVRHVLRIDDLDGGDVEDILARAERARVGSLERIDGSIVSLLFLSPSTRTRLGFEIAAAKLGGSAVCLTETRQTGPGLPPETLGDTLRVCSGMSDVVVVRADSDVMESVVNDARCPVVNGGDALEHPTQALIDRFAIEQLAGPIGNLHVGIAGDLTMRSVTSLLAVLALSAPRRLSLFAAPGRGPTVALPATLVERTEQPSVPEFAELDVLVLPGLPPGHGQKRLDDATRGRWALTPTTARGLPRGAIVLSPGPVIDEIHPDCRNDPRVRVLEEADLGLFVRMGLLSWLLEQA